MARSPSRAFLSGKVTGDDAHGSSGLRQFHVGNLHLEQGLITGFGTLVLRAQIHPKLNHLQRTAAAREIAE